MVLVCDNHMFGVIFNDRPGNEIFTQNGDKYFIGNTELFLCIIIL